MFLDRPVHFFVPIINETKPSMSLTITMGNIFDVPGPKHL